MSGIVASVRLTISLVGIPDTEVTRNPAVVRYRTYASPSPSAERKRISGGGRLEKTTILSSLSPDDRQEATECGSVYTGGEARRHRHLQCFPVQTTGAVL